MRLAISVILRGLRNVVRTQARRSRKPYHKRPLLHEQLETRRVLTLPLTQTFAEGDLLVYNGPTVDLVNDTSSFDAFIDFAGDIDSYFFTPQFSGTYKIDVGDLGNTVDPEIAIYVASTGVRVGYNDDVSAFNDDAQLVVNLSADIRYIIAVADNPATTAGNVSIIVTAPFRTGSFLLTPDVFGDVSASVLLDVPTDIDYYSITAPSDATGNLSISATASTLNQRLALFNSAGTLLQGPFVSISYSSVVPNQEYRIAVFSNNYATSGTLNLLIDFVERGAIVTNTLDSGPGSLRQAILDANAHPNVAGVADKIVFNIPGPGPHNVALATALPFITDAVDIDAGTQPGTDATPTVAIDGTALSGEIDGLRVDANGTAIRKLNIRNFPSDGIEVRASNVVLQSNTIGTDWGGISGLGNKGFGVRVQGGASNRIDSNVISGNVRGGIAIAGETADNNVLNGNIIGARFGGNIALPNGVGLFITDGDASVVSNNVISGNTLTGVQLTVSSTSNTITGNKIGTSLSGDVALPNGGDGILIQSSGNQIGGNLVALRNIISGNGNTGIAISSSNNVVEGNMIGTNLSGNAAIPNASHGVLVTNASNNRIGSATDAAARNVISGNGGSGVVFSQSGTSGGLVVGNFIGVASNGTSPLGNSVNGVLLTSGATNVQIGGSTAPSQNFISANRVDGILIVAGSNNNRISRNRIGITVSDTMLGNVGSGISIQSSGNTIGGADANFANIIAGNAHGITLSGATASNNTIAFNTIGIDTASNVGRGIQFASGASGNTVGPSNTIRRNETGIRVNDGSIKNKITRNAIGENINLGIDLFPSEGVTANDADDADGGGNLLQNWPVISASPVLVGAELELGFRISSSPTNSAYPLLVEFFVSDGGGEGARFIASTVYTAANFAAGIKTVSFVGAGPGLVAGVSKIVGIATDLNGNTSEFSTQQTVVSGGVGQNPVIASIGATATYNPGSPKVLVFPTATITDPDTINFANAVLTVTNTNGQATDNLAVVPTTTITVSGANVLFNGTIIGTFTGGAGTTPLAFTFNNQASFTRVQLVLNAIGFNSSSPAPSPTARTVSVQVTDGVGGTSALQSKLVNINQVPVIGSIGAAATYNATTAARVLVFPTATITDPDTVNFANAVLTVTNTNGQATDSLAIIPTATITVTGANVLFNGTIIGSFTGGTGTTPLAFSFNNQASFSRVQLVLNAVGFASSLPAPITTPRMISVRVTDGIGGTSALQSKLVNVI